MCLLAQTLEVGRLLSVLPTIYFSRALCFCLQFLPILHFFYTVTAHSTASRWRLSPLLRSTNIALCVSCTAPDKQHEKQHSHQSQRQHHNCCTGMQLCVRPSVCQKHGQNPLCVCVFLWERERDIETEVKDRWLCCINLTLCFKSGFTAFKGIVWQLGKCTFSFPCLEYGGAGCKLHKQSLVLKPLN